MIGQKNTRSERSQQSFEIFLEALLVLKNEPTFTTSDDLPCSSAISGIGLKMNVLGKTFSLASIREASALRSTTPLVIAFTSNCMSPTIVMSDSIFKPRSGSELDEPGATTFSN